MSAPGRNRPPVAVVGLGLIGGSVALRLLTAGYAVVAHDVDESTRRAAAGRGIRAVDTVDEAVEEAELVVLAVPLPAVDGVLEQLAGLPEFRRERLVLTDVTSVKAPVLELVRARGIADRYVGGHPMAGTERSGFGSADPGLIDGARWVLCVDGVVGGVDGVDGVREGALDVWWRVAAVVTDLGARVVPALAGEHDSAVATISHLPHVLAELLASAAARGPAAPLALALAAGSFRDGTRVAATRPELVAAMCDGNAAALADALDGLAAELDDVRRALRSGDGVGDLARAGHAARSSWERASAAAKAAAWSRPVNSTDLVGDLLDLGRSGGWVDRVDAAGLHGFRPEPAE